MSIVTTRAQRRELERTNAKMPRELRLIPRHEWPNPDGPQRRVWRSRDYLVQEFDAPAPACVRLSVNRTTLTGDHMRHLWVLREQLPFAWRKGCQ